LRSAFPELIEVHMVVLDVKFVKLNILL